jgi:uncharacterized damage-inducible protein DinB
MSMLRNLQMLMRYTTWANGLIFDAVSALPPGQATLRRPTLFNNMVYTLSHSCVIDQIWKAHLTGTAHGYTKRNSDAEPSLADLRVAQFAIDQWYLDYASGLKEAQLEEVVKFEFVDGGDGALTRGDILLHVVNHKTYHRGVVADLLYQVPVRAPAMDLPVFLRDMPQRR